MRHLYSWSTIIPFALVLLALSPPAACACACASLLLTNPRRPVVLECAEKTFFSAPIDRPHLPLLLKSSSLVIPRARISPLSYPFIASDIKAVGCEASCRVFVAMDEMCGSAFAASSCNICSVLGLDAFVACANCWIAAQTDRLVEAEYKRAGSTLERLGVLCSSYGRSTAPSLTLSANRAPVQAAPESTSGGAQCVKSLMQRRSLVGAALVMTLVTVALL